VGARSREERAPLVLSVSDFRHPGPEFGATYEAFLARSKSGRSRSGEGGLPRLSARGPTATNWKAPDRPKIGRRGADRTRKSIIFADESGRIQFLDRSGMFPRHPPDAQTGRGEQSVGRTLILEGIKPHLHVALTCGQTRGAWRVCLSVARR